MVSEFVRPVSESVRPVFESAVQFPNPCFFSILVSQSAHPVSESFGFVSESAADCLLEIFQTFDGHASTNEFAEPAAGS